MADNFVEILVRSRDEAKPDLDDLKAKLDELSHTVAEARANVSDKDAAAKLDRLQAKLLDLDHRTANPKIRMSGALRAEAEIHAVEASLDKLSRKEDEVIAKAGAGGLLNRIFNGAGGAAGGAGGSVPMLGNVPLPALAALVPVAAALVNEIAGLASGFAAAGAGAAAFYILARPTIKNLEQDYKALTSAQQAYQLAQQKAAIDPSKANLKAEHDALVKLQAVRKGMTADEASAAGGVARLSAEYHKLASAFAPDVFKVFNDGLKLANTLLPDVLPFARAFSDALDGLLRQANRFAGSEGFKHWLGQLLVLVGPSVTAIGQGIGKVAVQVGLLLTTLSRADVVNAINIAFTVLADTIHTVAAAVRLFALMWSGYSKKFAEYGRETVHGLAVVFDFLRESFIGVGHSFENFFDGMRHDIADFAHNIAAHFSEIRHTIAAWADDVGRFVTKVVDWFIALPGRILRALGHIGSLLVQAGRDLVAGFIRGIESMFGAVASAAQRLVDSLGKKVLHILGIGSPSRVAHWWGEMIGQGLAEGIDASASRSAAAAARMAAGVAAGLGGPRGLPGGGISGGGLAQPLRIELELTGSGDPLLTWLRQAIRVKGGNVQKVLGHG